MKLITQFHLVLGLGMSGAIPLLPIYAFMAHNARALSSLLLTFWTLTAVCNFEWNTVLWKVTLLPICRTVCRLCTQFLICHVLLRIQRQWEKPKASVTSSAMYCLQLKIRVLTLTSCTESPTSGLTQYRQNTDPVNTVSTTVYRSLRLQFEWGSV